MSDTPVVENTNQELRSATRTLTVTIRTRTPLWTGGVDGTMDRIHETGILGSLRWWYEAIVRGLGGSACDPTEHEHELSGQRLKRYEGARKKGKDWWAALDEAGICDACKVFGTTGWRRRFRLEIVENQIKPIWEPRDKMLNIRPPGRTRGWYLPPGWMGTLTLKFTGDPKILSLMAALLLFLEEWGNLGAKPQLGYGVFAIENRDEVLEWAQDDGQNKSGWKWAVAGDGTPDSPDSKDSNLPDLRQFRFFKFRFGTTQPGWWTRIPGLNRVALQVQPLVSQYNIVPVSPALKNEWRFNQWNRKWGDDREIFGTLWPNRIRSRVAVSWAYRVNGAWKVQGWTWLTSPKWDEKMWSILKDDQIWQTVLKVHGQMNTHVLRSSDDVQRMLEEAKDDKQ